MTFLATIYKKIASARGEGVKGGGLKYRVLSTQNRSKEGLRQVEEFERIIFYSLPRKRMVPKGGS